MKRLAIVLSSAAIASVLLVAPAGGNVGSLSINCERVAASLTQFPPGGHTITFIGDVDGTPFDLTDEATIGEDGTGSAHVNIVDLTGAGDSAVNPQPVTVTATATWTVAGGGATEEVTFTDTCAIPEPTTTTIAPDVPVVPEVPEAPAPVLPRTE